MKSNIDDFNGFDIKKLAEAVAEISEEDKKEAQRVANLVLGAARDQSKVIQLLQEGSREELCAYMNETGCGYASDALNALGDKWDVLMDAARVKRDVTLIAEPLSSVLLYTKPLPECSGNAVQLGFLAMLAGMAARGDAE